MSILCCQRLTKLQEGNQVKRLHFLGRSARRVCNHSAVVNFWRLPLLVQIASFINSPGKCSLIDDSISLELRVYLFEKIIRLRASCMILMKSSARILLTRSIPFLEMLNSGLTSFITLKMQVWKEVPSKTFLCLLSLPLGRPGFPASLDSSVGAGSELIFLRPK